MRIVLLRGLAREAAHWFDFSQQLQKHLGGADSILTPDFAGCGKCYQQPAASSIAAMTAHMRQQISVAKNEKIILVGLSLGGMVALDWTVKYPEEIAGIVLINSSLGGHPLTWRLQPSAWLSALQSFMLSPAKREKIVLRNVSNNREQYAVNETLWLAIQQQRPVTLQTVLRMLLAAKTFRVSEFPTQIPGLVLASENDRLVSVNCSKDISLKSHWALKIHPWAGHDLPLDDASWVGSEILQWMQEKIDPPAAL